MLQKFIERPVLSTVISILLVILGAISALTLPISQFPDIAPPTVVVTASYPGANAETVARSVATPIEEAVNGVENMTYMTSNSSNDGSMTLTVFFKQGTDPDIAAVNVQNRVSKASNKIPQEVIQAGISTQKQQNSFLMFVALTSKDSLYDEAFIQNYLKINVIPQMQRIPGVAEVQPFGGREYAMRIWLQPDRLVAYNLSPQDVMRAVADQNVEAAPGRLGQSSPQMFEYVLKYKGKLNRNEDYENIIIKATNDGQLVRLKDVARVSFGSFSYAANSRLNGGATSGIALLQTAGSNANEILIEAKRQIEVLKETLPKGIEPIVMFNAKDFLDESISQVNHTLIEAFILVFLVVFIFLQDFRSTLIPAIAVPVAIIGTFFFMQLFGFSINLLTLFALVLAIGIVVDDAIVVVEAVHSKMERTGLSPRDATQESMKEISGAIVSITLVMVAVFVPVTFMQGPAGVFYTQFAFTLAVAILISALNALTLSPALCALFLKNPHAEGHAADHSGGFLKRFFRAFNVAFTAITDKYVRSLQLLMRRKWVVVSGLALVTAVTAVMIQRTPTGFIPTEDQGFVLYAVNTPPGSSLARTERAMKQIEEIVAKEPFTLNHYQVDGLNFISNANAAPYGAGFIRTKPKDQRGPIKDYEAIAASLTQKVAAEVKGAQAVFFTFPTVSGFGNVDGFEFMLQDRGNGSLEKLDATAKSFIAALSKREEIAFAFTTFAANNPQYELVIDDEKAKQLGVNVSDLLQTMQIYFGSTFVSDFNRFGKFYRVIAQADIPYRASASSLNEIYVKNAEGGMVAANTMVTLDRVYGPETVTRNNLYNAVTINGKPNVGYSTGDAITAIEETAAEVLPRSFAYEWTGMTREEKSAGSQLTVIFIMSLVFVFFLLAAQYESYILPLAVVITIPLGIFGVMLFINLMGIENNIYVQVAMIMLIGLLAKNAILIVEYALQRRRAGMGLLESALEASRLRLRPILMTSFAFIVGMIPLLRATGGSALGNHSIGAGAVGGMLTGVLLGIFVIPVLFVIFQYLQERVGAKRKGQPALQPAALLLAVALLAYGCSTGRETVRPAGAVPDTFRTVSAASMAPPAADSSSMAHLPWKQFFTDTALQRIVDSVLARNYDMQVALNTITLNEKYLKQARAAWLPTVQADVSANTSRPSENSLNGVSLGSFLGTNHIEDYTAALGVSWEVDVWGKIKQQEQASLAAYLQSTEAVKSLQTRLIAASASAYYTLLMLHEQLDITRRNLALSDSTLRAIRLQYAAGQASILAVQQAEVQLEKTKAWIPKLEQALLMQENALSILMAREPQAIATGVPLHRFAVPEQFAVGIPAAMVSRRPDVKESEYALDIANAQVGIAQANRYPALRITAAGGLNAFQASNWFVMPASLFGNLAGNVMQPVFNGRKLKTQFEAAKIQRENAVIRFRQTVLNAVGEVADALAQLDKLKAQIEITESQKNKLEKAIPNAQLLFASGMASYLEVITAQQNALQSELELADLKRQQIEAYVLLYRSLGGGVE
ncbi:efflux RND transporter permease subunit [Parapedobacter sp. GCM10030251]|uniref:efflux RND transporter permease subunit n=1 Tax=Parapedobacter sp. GCM10030251 TaxID=3273419 RepID=UPI0036197C06